MAESKMVDQRTAVEAKWNQIRSAIRARWSEVSADDLRNIDGDSRKLVALINQKTKTPLPEIESAIDELAASSGGLLNRLTTATRVMAADVARQVTEPTQAAARSVRTAINESPTKAVGAVFGAGLLTGLMVGLMLLPPGSRR